MIFLPVFVRPGRIRYYDTLLHMHDSGSLCTYLLYNRGHVRLKVLFLVPVYL